MSFIFYPSCTVLADMPNNRYPVNNQRIVNGYDTNGAIPYQLRLDVENYRDGICGAVLISADLAISAAHCFWNHETGNVNM